MMNYLFTIKNTLPNARQYSRHNSVTSVMTFHGTIDFTILAAELKKQSHIPARSVIVEGPQTIVAWHFVSARHLPGHGLLTITYIEVVMINADFMTISRVDS